MAVQAGAADDTRAVAKDDKKDAGQMSQRRLMVRRFLENKLSIVGLIVLLIMYAMAAISSFLAPYDYDAIDSNSSYKAPTKVTWAGGPAVCGEVQTLDEVNLEWKYATDCSKTYPIEFFNSSYPYKLFGFIPTNVHLFGVPEVAADPNAVPVEGQARPAELYLVGGDKEGRDVFSRILQGSRVSLTVGLVGVTLATILGAILGTASGYFGGAIDNVMQRLIELIGSIPTIPLWAALAAALPGNISVVRRYFFITLILSLVAWTGLARQVRGKVLSYRSADYTSAARAAGGSHLRVIMTHMIPNASSHIIVVAALAVPATILAETTLSFLGFGMQAPAVSWGTLLQDAQNISVVQRYPWLLLPGLAVVIALICYQFLGDGLRDAADPYS